MNAATLKTVRLAALALALTATIVASGCFGAGDKTIYRQAGSSTVLPVAQAWAERYGEMNEGVSFVVGGGGTGAGFKQFCAGEIHIADASRPIKDSEKAECAKKSITPFEIQVAIDGLAVVVSKQNTFANNLTTSELHRIWTAVASKQANKWRDLRPAWPDQKIILYGPGTDSGTFDYFNEAIIHPVDGNSAKTRSDYTPSEDDNVLVQGIRNSPYALGYFGLAYVAHNTATIRALPIDEGKGAGAMEPTAANVESGKYKPLARPIFMYTNGKPTGDLRAYFEFGLSQAGQNLVSDVGYIPVPEAKRTTILNSLK